MKNELPANYTKCITGPVKPTPKHEVLSFNLMLFGLSIFIPSLFDIFYPVKESAGSVVLLVSLTTLIILHEVFHATATYFLGGHPHFGFYKHPMFWYCPAIWYPDFAARNEVVAVLVAPQIITIGCLGASLLWVGVEGRLLGVLAITNLLLGAADLLSIVALLHQKEATFYHSKNIHAETEIYDLEREME